MDFNIIIHFSTHPLRNICTSDSEAFCLLVILKNIMKETIQDLFIIKCIYNLLVDHGFEVFYSCMIQKSYNPIFDLELEFFYQLSNYRKPLVSVEAIITVK